MTDDNDDVITIFATYLLHGGGTLPSFYRFYLNLYSRPKPGQKPLNVPIHLGRQNNLEEKSWARHMIIDDFLR